jgi:hypothetical protein
LERREWVGPPRFRKTPSAPATLFDPGRPSAPSPLAGALVLGSGEMTPSPSAVDRFEAESLKPGATPVCGLCLSLCTLPAVRSVPSPTFGEGTCPGCRQHSGWGGWLGLPIRFVGSGPQFMFSCSRACSVWRDFHPQRHAPSPGAPSRSCWIATVCGAPVAARLQLEIGFFIEDKLLRLVFDTAALRRRGDECSNNLEMHPS